MFRYFRFYIAPLAMIGISLCMLLGSQYIWLLAFIWVSGVALLDQVFKYDIDESKYKYPFFLDLALYMSMPATLIMYFILFWIAASGANDPFGFGAWVTSMTGFDVITARNNTAWYHYLLLFPAIALPATGVGGLAGHELTHRTWRPFDLWLGRITMAFNWGIAFPIEHVYGHHAYVATTKDPATAARGDNIYQHFPKALHRTITNAWEIETERLDKVGKSFISWNNVLLRMSTVGLATSAFAFYCAGWTGVLFHLIVCTFAKLALETLNFVEHYGLLRDPRKPVQPRHSWNCNHVVSGITSYNLTRHSHHHADAQAPYQDLKAHAEQPMMPGGLMTAYLSSLIPPLWRKKITPKLLEWDREQAVKSEYELIRKANTHSGWAELGESVCNQQLEKQQPQQAIPA